MHPSNLLPLVTLAQALHYEARSGWLYRWLRWPWLQGYYVWKVHRHYARYLRTLPEADQRYLQSLNRKLRPCARSPDP